MPKQHLLPNHFQMHFIHQLKRPKTITCMIDISDCKHTNTHSIYDKTKKYTKLPHEIKQHRRMLTSDNCTRLSGTSKVPTLYTKITKF
jgi:hypothetical protein